MEAPIFIDLPDSDILYYQEAYPAKDAHSIYSRLMEETPWRAEKITVFAKTYEQPRLTAWYGEEGKSYSYSNIIMDYLMN